ncbi:hypothetical protein C8R43DRAFT_991856 [Mycena crocata]|nr:hypothetical protein C8R43DRAFT_991856 [Mycena crocata]
MQFTLLPFAHLGLVLFATMPAVLAVPIINLSGAPRASVIIPQDLRQGPAMGNKPRWLPFSKYIEEDDGEKKTQPLEFRKVTFFAWDPESSKSEP